MPWFYYSILIVPCYFCSLTIATSLKRSINQEGIIVSKMTSSAVSAWPLKWVSYLYKSLHLSYLILFEVNADFHKAINFRSYCYLLDYTGRFVLDRLSYSSYSLINRMLKKYRNTWIQGFTTKQVPLYWIVRVKSVVEHVHAWV